MRTGLKQTISRFSRVAVSTISFSTIALSAGLAAATATLPAQDPAEAVGPPPSTGGFFPLSQVTKGLHGTAWTVFTGSKPEPMDVEILGVLRGARGPGQDMILAQLHGAHPEYTGVVAGMSGSPVYIGGKLLGALSYRIGQFSKDPIAGITPIEQMLEVRDLPLGAGVRGQGSGVRGQGAGDAGGAETFRAMETPLVMSGFRPEAIEFWQKQMAGTALERVSAGGMGGSSKSDGGQASVASSAAARGSVVPGSAVSMQLVRGDMEIAATCTVTYVDPKQLLACGHPVLQAGDISLPMTTTDVVATLASPLNAFKIVNTGETIGAFTEDRDSAIRGEFGARARMIPMHIAVDGPGDGPGGKRKVNVEILDQATLTPQAMLVVLYQSLLETNENTAETSYHLTGSFDVSGYAPLGIDVWAVPGENMPAPMAAALQAGERFARIFSNSTRLGAVRSIDIHVESIPRRVQMELEAARLVSGDLVHAGDTVVVEATVRPWQQAARNIRIEFNLPSRLGEGNVRLLVSDAGTLDRAMELPRPPGRAGNLDSVLAQERKRHAADHIFVSILEPETQAGVGGETLSSLPLSVANALEPMRSGQDVNLNGESAEVAGEAPAGGVVTGFQVLNMHIEPGGGLN